MSEIKLNQEIISALQNCKDAKSVMAFAKSKGVELGEEKAGKIFEMFQNDKLTDEELEKVVGSGFLDVLHNIGKGLIQGFGGFTPIVSPSEKQVG